MTPFLKFFFLASLSLLLLQTSVCLAVPLTVTVEGVEGELSTNIKNRLKIFLHQADPAITARQIRRLHKRAPEEIAAALAPYGYYSVKVDSSLAASAEGWQAVYRVSAGPAVTVDRLSVGVTGPGRGRPFFENLAAAFPLQPGDPLKDSLYEEGKKKIQALALVHGYNQARFTEHTVVVRRKEGLADISLRLETGPLFHFGATTSRQQIITTDLFQRFIPYRPGDVYSLRALNQLQASLYATGYFSQVLVEPKFSESRDENIPVEVSLRPATANRYSFGVGYGTDTGMRGRVGWKNRLVNRFGHKPSFTAQLSEQRSSVKADYEIPVFDPRDDRLILNGQYLDDTWDNTWTERLSFGGSVNHHTPKNQYGAGLEIRRERYTVGVTSGSADLLMPTAYWNLILARDRINTSNGIRLSATVKGADKAILSSTSFIQFRLSSKVILTPLEGWRILGRGTIGATSMESLTDLPPSLRFYAGGDQSVRGYGYKELGPVDFSGVVVGGRYLLDGSVEIEHRLTSMWSVAAFFDVGNAFDDIEAELKQGAGAGLRLSLPFGQIRIDVASALSEAGQPFRLHLTVGADL